MTQIEKKKTHTDQAWDLLYNRLEQDGLLPDTEGNKRTFLRSATFKWVASIAVLLMSMAVASIVINNNLKEQQLLSLHNEKDEATLVTTLEDGSIVYLADQTSLHYPKHFEKKKREVFLEGNAFFDVKGNRERPFVIETDQIQVEVLGTAFNVKGKDVDNFSLSVDRGEVKVTLKKTGQSIHIKAGETGLLHSNQLETVATKDMNQFQRYTKQIQFKDERLVDVVRVINKNADGVELEVAPGLEDRLLTVTFSNDSPYSMAQLICMALNLECVQQQDKIRISELK
ncbi:FecR family protein [Dysgonomonas sp. GY617]|uniref:FecR family protein n=1 Tax=Dysgonomonas sp. GY617 TaxID=2780420 RepID=UPI001883E781|nr:FecR family protein [Dysgonomonas sp. GY617]MBF0577480.1 FecR domain-containing protein [Dysgonomonas sp. GY617]